MQWVSGNRYLTQTEMENNVSILTLKFLGWGWTHEAIAGMVGNMQTESSVNPGIWENLDAVAKGGYGLVQWTPYTKYSEWAGAGWENNGDKECERIQWELENGAQWASTDKYPMSFGAFVTSKESPDILADVWLYNYERPADLNQPARGKQALAWFPFIQKIKLKKPLYWLYAAMVNEQRRQQLW